MPRVLNTTRSWLALVALCGTVAALTTIDAADHRDAPILIASQANTQFDINDIYVFRSPQNPSNTVFVMTVCPAAGILSPTTFASPGFYDFRIDTNGDAREDRVYRVTFGPPGVGGVQNVTLQQQIIGGGGAVLLSGQTGQNIAVPGGGTFRAALHDDPFFFNFNAFVNDFRNPPSPNFGQQSAFPNPGTNFFAGFNACIIVLEVPSASLGGTNLGVWGRTERNGVQMDRMAIPVVLTVLMPPALTSGDPRASKKNAFNGNQPRNDKANFLSEAITTLRGPIGNTPSPYGLSQADASGLANFLLPDILPFSTGNAGGFPNGRKLADDVMDVVLTLGTGGRVTTDNVANDSVFLNTFPYVAAPN